jgi:RecA-family ATPase/5S rRNA maturation endonuclease (ribonuclease M5)
MIREIKARALEVYRYYLPNISTRKNILCPFHSDKKTKSFRLYSNADDLKFKCFGCGRQGDCIDFIQEIEGYTDPSDAIKRAKEILGLNNNSHKRKALTLQQIEELKLDGNYTFQRKHTYKAGNPEYIKAIYRDPEGNKQARYFTLIDSNKGLYLLERKSKPVLYNQELLAQRPDDIVCYVEGEKDCDTLTGLGFLTVTAGSATDFNSYMAHHKAEHFKRRDVVLFSDNDSAGHESVRRITEALSPIAKSVKQVNLQKAWNETLKDSFEMPQGADITDFVEVYTELFNDDVKEVILKMIRDAESVKIEKKSLLDSLLKWNDIFDFDFKTEYLLDRLIPKGSITLLFGRGGIGKTSLALQIARAIAEGLSFGELKTIKTPVYYIDFENPLSVLKERVEKIGQADNLYVWHLSNNPMPPKLDSKDWELYKDLPAGLFIFDTLRASHLLDENNSQDMAVIISRLKELRELGFTILILHHTPKGSENIYKGSTALLDLADHCLGLEGLKGDIEFDRDNIYRLGTRIKTRYDPYHIYLTFNPEIKGFETTKDPDIEKMEAIYELLKQSKEPLKQKELKEQAKRELDLTESEVRRLLKKGTGLYWEIQKGDKNATLYTPLNSSLSVCQSIYTQQTNKQKLTQPENLENRESSNTKKSIKNTKFDSLSEGILQTEKQDECNYKEGSIKNDKVCIGIDKCDGYIYTMKFNPQTRKLERWCGIIKGWCEMNHAKE